MFPHPTHFCKLELVVVFLSVVRFLGESVRRPPWKPTPITMPLQGYGGGATAPPPNPANETLSPDAGGVDSNKSGPNPSGDAREQTSLTIADASAAASGNPNDTSVSNENIQSTSEGDNYGRNTDEEEEIQEGWGHDNDIHDIGINGAGSTASLASTSLMDDTNDKETDPTSKRSFEQLMEDETTATLHQPQESQGSLAMNQMDDAENFVSPTASAKPEPKNLQKSYNIKLVFPKDQNKPEQMTRLISRMFTKDS